MGMTSQIIPDAKAMDAETTRGEANSQKAYEDFVHDGGIRVMKRRMK